MQNQWEKKDTTPKKIDREKKENNQETKGQKEDIANPPGMETKDTLAKTIDMPVTTKVPVATEEKIPETEMINHIEMKGRGETGEETKRGDITKEDKKVDLTSWTQCQTEMKSETSVKYPKRTTNTVKQVITNNKKTNNNNINHQMTNQKIKQNLATANRNSKIMKTFQI